MDNNNTKVINGKENLLTNLIKYNYNECDYDLKIAPLFSESIMFNGTYDCYLALFLIPKSIVKKATYGIIDSQLSNLRIFDNTNNVLLESTTDGYDDISIPTAFYVCNNNSFGVRFEEILDFESNNNIVEIYNEAITLAESIIC